jgi:hypothetical protein
MKKVRVIKNSQAGRPWIKIDRSEESPNLPGEG